MNIFQYKCRNCNAVFEHIFSCVGLKAVSCLVCGCGDVVRCDSTFFNPNRSFCPKDHFSFKSGLGRDKFGLVNVLDTDTGCKRCI